jgi:hypothetical protein
MSQLVSELLAAAIELETALDRRANLYPALWIKLTTYGIDMARKRLSAAILEEKRKQQ